MRYVAKFVAALSVLGGGCTAIKTPSRQDIQPPQAATARQQPSPDEGGKYEDIISGRAKTADGATFSFQSYKSPDGIGISTRLERRDTPARAEKELLRNIKAAVEVIERGQKLDEGGRQVGKRAVLTMHQEGSTKLQTKVLWTEGAQLYSIESLSLQHALNFEKWYLRKF